MADDDLDQQEPQRQLSPVGLYSHASEVADRFPQMKGTPQQFKAMLAKQGVKPDELKWSGYDQKFAGRPLITKQEMAQHFRENVPKVQETMLRNTQNKYPYRHAEEWQGALDQAERAGDWDEQQRLTLAWEAAEGHGGAGQPKFQQYTLPGGQNYREVLMQLPRQLPAGYRVDQSPGGLFHVLAPDGAIEGIGGTQERAVEKFYRDVEKYGAAQDYRSLHWDQPNVLAHLRMSDRKGPKGEKLLHLEELQSDWAQEGRKKGFEEDRQRKLDELIAAEKRSIVAHQLNRPDKEQRLAEYQDLEKKYGHHVGSKGLPAAPYVDSTQKWVDLGLKRLLHEAARGGYHKIVMTPGEEQAKRYDLSKHINEVHYSGTNLVARDHAGKDVMNRTGVLPEQLPDIIGKEAAEKLLNQPKKGTLRSLYGQDLKVGGEGMKAFYDKMLPQALEKLAKKHDPEAKIVPSALKLKVKTVPRDVLELQAQRLAEEDGERWADLPARIQQGYLDGARETSKKTQLPARLHMLEITPKMRASILKGQPAYASGGKVPAERPEVWGKPGWQQEFEPQDEKLPKAAGGSVDHDPSEAQKAAGNYAKERVSFQGLPVSIENKRGSIRSGVDEATGKRWSARLPADYGYVRGTEGADGEHVDCFLGPVRNSPLVVVVDQHDHRNGRFDEHKCMLGYRSERDALRDYAAAFSDGHGHDRVGHVQSMSVDAFKKWLKGDKTKRPAASQSIVDQALQLAASKRAA